MHGVYEANFTIPNLSLAPRTLLHLVTGGRAVEILEARVHLRRPNGFTENDRYEAHLARVDSLGTPTATTVTAWPTEGTNSPSAVVKGNVTAGDSTYRAPIARWWLGYCLWTVGYRSLDHYPLVLGPGQGIGLILNGPIQVVFGQPLRVTASLLFRER